MDNLSPQEVLKLLEAEADMLQQMQRKVEDQLTRLQREEEIILRSATWMRGQQTKIAGAEDLAPLPRPLSPLHEAKVESLSDTEQRRDGTGGDIADGVHGPEDADEIPSDYDDKLALAFEAGSDEDEDDEDPG